MLFNTIFNLNSFELWKHGENEIFRCAAILYSGLSNLILCIVCALNFDLRYYYYYLNLILHAKKENREMMELRIE